MNKLPRIHGGPDGQGAPLHDFSTNSNACGPCPLALAAVQQADATRYPDPGYTDLRRRLADFYGVDAGRILLAGSASECIFRTTAWVRQQGDNTVSLPAHAYGDYAHAAQAWGLRVVASPDDADLAWACEPSSPLGQNHGPWPAWLQGDAAHAASTDQVLVVDCAYAPLRLDGAPSLGNAQRQRVWQLFSPNKALGLTGVRAAFAIAPLGAEAAVAQLDALAPSWVLGAHGVAMLQAWTQAATQDWLLTSLHSLRGWKASQVALLQGLGWTVLPSDTPYFCARPPQGVDVPALCEALRARGIKLRDAASFGLPGHVRLGVLPPAAQQALADALQSLSPSKVVEGACF
ncbi:aminotransferase class I/II-fold pyridoxal phosphate-dependent enzyme [Rhodoferax sp. AJA081-3]|uniref:aminotransferase class I/II-fold pyridoxal phosphate-dependent enzyme n=1 Tax=Rhodoferax sp. AJA081-3 TaxID=2752316 RepID=UPI001AE02BAF|nr:aminotransferase class I/II-fold pyridoxal phosphate-dependent enzyme [Rhodoferax sp. AJA081-3]QTN29064.1 aminotransferase class I/II-fold pyridoxal phosphate-dependent enzyme [Rhodoferax sp. AJA081-3]